MGHAGGMTMCDLRRATISPYVSNAIPRNWASANIVAGTVTAPRFDRGVFSTLLYRCETSRTTCSRFATTQHHPSPWIRYERAQRY
jgi:hypothetical protein